LRPDPRRAAESGQAAAPVRRIPNPAPTGDDVIVAGSGSDRIDGAKGFDTCDGGGGLDYVGHCEA
jgi:hypothetical protein